MVHADFGWNVQQHPSPSCAVKTAVVDSLHIWFWRSADVDVDVAASLRITSMWRFAYVEVAAVGSTRIC